MQAISDLKEQAVVDTPLIVFDCVLSNGQTEHWSTHALTVGQTAYAARVIQHSAFDIQTASDQGVDGSPRISIVLANADSHFSEIERSCGWKGAQMTVSFLFYDLRNNVPLTDAAVVFQGICNPPDQIQEATFRLTAINRMNLQRLMLPQVRIQRRCPWSFPATPEQRAEAVDGGVNGKYSMYYRCGYSAGVAGGTGNMNGSEPYTTCGYTRTDCQARGMFTRFGGLEFVPSAIQVRGYGKDWTTSNLSVNQARYNDYVPMVYGTAWYSPDVVFARNDGNLTRMEVLLGIGQMQDVLTVLVSGVEIPRGVTGQNMTGSGWYNIETLGTRDGCFDSNFTDALGHPAGDPYGSMAYLSVVVPNQLNNGSSLPNVQVLVQGLLVPVYGADGSYVSDQFSSNPAWILLDVLRRSGWSAPEIDIPSFARAAAYCDEAINVLDPNGNTISLPRFECNLVLQNRRSAGDLVRGVRNCARLYLTYETGGALQLNVENTAALEKAAKPVGSNSTEPLNGGWPSYEFGDGSNGFSGILRKGNGEPSVTLTSRSIADTPNRMTVEFQDALNGYQQDSYEMVDPEDIALAGQEVSSSLMALGLPQYDQAARMLKFNLDKSVRGNTYIQFQTSVKAFGVRPGDLITVTYQKEGLNRQPFRVLKLSPATNYRTTTITAQVHDDAWYADTNGQVTSPSGTNQSGNSAAGTPRPLLGSVLDANGNVQFGVEETATASSDGTVETSLLVSFVTPAIAAGAGPGTPLLNISSTVGSGGTLKGGQTLYYAISGENSAMRESALSFLVRTTLVNDGSAVTLTGLSFAPGTTAFHVYRGVMPAQMFRIASDQPVATQFTDTGLAAQLMAPPDPNFDHANFYWRSELQPEIAVTVHTPASVGNGSLQMAVNGYRGMTVRISRGTGAGQERTVVANDATTLTVSPAWSLEPDATSFLVVAEAGWHFGAVAKASPVQFAVPNRTGEMVEVTGRSANVNDVECSPALSTVSRWTIGGSGGADSQVPPQPFFGIGPGTAGGTIELSGVSFTDLTNTTTISSGTLTLHYWNELLGTPATILAGGLGATDTSLTLGAAGPAVAGTVLQIDREVLRVTAVAGAQYTVARGINGTAAGSHVAGSPVYHLSDKTVIAPFPPGFFGSPYCGSWSYPVTLPDIRLACAELFLTNDVGNSPTAAINLTHNDDSGLRTLSGGQYSIQVDGYLAVEQCVAPPIVLEASHAVRDVYAVLGSAADAAVQVQVNVNGALYCALTFQAGAVLSSSVNGNTLPPLPMGAQLTASVTAVGQTNPGANLTVLIRL
jgi:Putative phage tail protein